ncbi:MAG TPA: hypothetical protein ENL43_03280, partial [candidate division WOR-3 bacterium]|nr:hypothetical protein [candidate division WOR-3 bacterium]
MIYSEAKTPMNKRDYEALLKRNNNRLLYAIYRETKETLQNVVKYPYSTVDSKLDEILYVLLLLIYNYAIWDVLDTEKIIQLSRLYPLVDPLALDRIERALKYDKGLLKSIYRDKFNQLKQFDVAKIMSDTPDEVKYYLSTLQTKLLADAQRHLMKKQVEGANVEQELKHFFNVRGRLIAETEGVRFFNLGVLRGANFGGVVAYRYVAMMDNKTCPLCRARHGKIILANDYASLLEHTPPIHPNCYTEGHLLWTKSGWKHWDEVEKGERVWSLNPKTQKVELARVVCKIKYWYEGKVY